MAFHRCWGAAARQAEAGGESSAFNRPLLGKPAAATHCALCADLLAGHSTRTAYSAACQGAADEERVQPEQRHADHLRRLLRQLLEEPEPPAQQPSNSPASGTAAAAAHTGDGAPQCCSAAS